MGTRSSPAYPGTHGWRPVSDQGTASRNDGPCPRFRRTPGAADVYCMAGIYTFTGHGPAIFGHGGLDLFASMFAPCSLGCPGTPRSRAASSGRRHPAPLDQWSRPSRRASGARLELWVPKTASCALTCSIWLAPDVACRLLVSGSSAGKDWESHRDEPPNGARIIQTPKVRADDAVLAPCKLSGMIFIIGWLHAA